MAFRSASASCCCCCCCVSSSRSHVLLSRLPPRLRTASPARLRFVFLSTPSYSRLLSSRIPASAEPPLSIPRIWWRSLAQVLLSALAGDRLRRLLPAAHARVVATDGLGCLLLTNLLLRGYSKLGLLQDARRLFDGMLHRNLVSWSSAISMYAQHGDQDQALLLFSAFRKSSIQVPNEFLLASVLRACTQSGAVPFGEQLHGIAAKLGLDVNLYVGTALINLYAKAACMDAAMRLFHALPAKNPVTWTAVIAGYSQIGQGRVALDLFQKMRVQGVQPDRFVLASAVSACSAPPFLQGGRQIHAYAYRCAAEMDASVTNSLIDLYCKCSKPLLAHKLFDRTKTHNLVSWTTMISGYMQNSLDAEAMDMFWQMCRSGWQPDAFASTSVLNSCGSLEAIWQGRQVHAHAIKANLEADEYVKNALIDMYAKCDHLAAARAVFDALAHDDAVSYNTMIEGYASQLLNWASRFMASSSNQELRRPICRECSNRCLFEMFPCG